MKIVFCKNCGAKLEEDHTFCSECGQTVDLVNLNQQEKSENDVSCTKQKKPKIKLLWGLKPKNFKSMSLKEKVKFIIASFIFWFFILIVLLIILMAIFSDDFKSGYETGKEEAANDSYKSYVIKSDNPLTGLSFSYTFDTLLKNYDNNVKEHLKNDLNNNKYQTALNIVKLGVSDFQEETPDIEGCRKFSWRTNNDSLLFTVEEDSNGNIFYAQSTINTNQPESIITTVFPVSWWFLAAANPNSNSVDETHKTYQGMLDKMANSNLSDYTIKIDKNVFGRVVNESNCLRLIIYASESKIE